MLRKKVSRKALCFAKVDVRQPNPPFWCETSFETKMISGFARLMTMFLSKIEYYIFASRLAKHASILCF